MFSNKFLKLIIFFVIIFYSNIAIANDKIYYIDIDTLMNNSLAGKSIAKQLNKNDKSNNENFKKLEENLKNEETKLISQKNILKKDEYQKKVELFKQKISKYKNKRNTAINNLSKKRIEGQKIFISQLMPILSEYSEKNSISYIIPKQTIIIGKTELDLTKKILKILDSKVKSIKLK